MGRTGSSSSRKYSKKKSLKGYRKKKSRRNKSKKLRRHDVSFSSWSDDESTSSSLNSSSSLEGEYRSKRSRSRSRNEIKGRKKRNRRRSLSEDSSKDLLPVKKRKRSKRGKRIKKKKSKRDAYTSSVSTDSGSCSTCKGEDSSSEELDSHGRSRGRSIEKKKDRRNSTKGRTGNRKNMSKNRSSFSPSSSDELGSYGRSRGRSNEKRRDHRGSTKGRIGSRKNRSKTRSSSSPSSSYGSESIEKVTMENNPMRLKSVITVANLENEEDTMKDGELKEETVYDYDDYPSKSNDSTELVERFNSSPDKTSVVKEVNSGSNLNDNKGKESNTSGNIGSEVDNLESILRQKALENLSRFRGGSKTKPLVPVDNKPKSDQSGVKPLKHETVSMTPVSQPLINRSRFTWRRDPSVTTGKDEKAATYTGPRSSGSQPVELKLQSANLPSPSRVDDKIVNETLKLMVNTDSVDQKSSAVVETPSSVSTKEGSSKEQQNESNDNSQFEKKTMSVMRGGEMVQVSYKVYIPNRAPALARRQLKR